ncbi:hypothetical protein CDAR_556521 [Caerostris darwini]|uniref:Uncharacterized protein n=1 Tax=Caerostris darwini TaxID=1538125 RepID=A0AAV4S708_9ARAC|nr:hypothetical protein CDAR_556521 [Caerostris darwini]
MVFSSTLFLVSSCFGLLPSTELERGGGGNDWKREEMEGDGNLRTEGRDDLERQESHHAPGLPKLVLSLPDTVGSIISLPCLFTVA